MRYLATLRCAFDAEDEVGARLSMHGITEAAAQVLEDADTIDVTQIIPFIIKERDVEPTEVVNQMRLVRDMLIKTRITQCFDLAKEIDKVAWVLEHRQEESFDLTSYDYTAIFDRAEELLDADRS